MKSNLGYKQQAPMGYLIHEVARLLKRRFEDQARVHGITLPQWRVLAQIALNEGITQVALAAATDTDPMTVSGVLDRLEKRGLIDRYADPTDSRAKLARLTPEGEQVFTTTRTVGFAMYEAALEGITPEEREIAIKALSRMRDNLIGQTAELEEI
ncbi:MAG: MarR family transcriptional regulator [Devosia sp.]|uniref:MarR family winged helix-turn-helix transcriptional regulator n=1 Tax=Devosia sp. TaxID=1871048 RepID=UPI0026325FA8|nr:MarR family transcriptional regulator [Devosia sp.]MDB5540041.1 MarR family transcriptional regulator [Devosia sp.]